MATATPPPLIIIPITSHNTEVATVTRAGQDRFVYCKLGDVASVWIVADGHGSTAVIATMIVATLPSFLASTFASVTTDADIPPAITAAFAAVVKLATGYHAGWGSGSTCTMAVRRHGGALFLVQLGDGIARTVDANGDTVVAAAMHNASNPAEVARITEANMLNDRLAGIFQPFRGMGNGELEKESYRAWGRTFNPKGAFSPVPEIHQLDEEEMARSVHLIVASDGIVAKDHDFDTDYKHMLNTPYVSASTVIAAAKEHERRDDITLLLVTL
jgi:serine/threonine protein phosphatase PrpC